MAKINIDDILAGLTDDEFLDFIEDKVAAYGLAADRIMDRASFIQGVLEGIKLQKNKDERHSLE